MSMQRWAYITGIVCGLGLIGSVVFVYVTTREIAIPGLGLSLVGALLVGMSIWSSVKIKIDQTGVDAEFRRLQGQVNKIAEAAAEVSEEVTKIARVTEANRSYFAEVDNFFETHEEPPPERLSRFRDQVLDAPLIDLQRLDSAKLRLESIETASNVEHQIVKEADHAR